TEIRRRQRRRQRCRVAGSALSELEERSIASDADPNRQSRIRILADVDQWIVGAFFSLFCGIFKTSMMPIAAIKLADEVEPFAFAARNLVEVLLHLRGERHIDEVTEMRTQQPGDGECRKTRH